MAELSKWVIPESMQDEYISNLTKMLSGLRDLMGINQSDIAKMIGVSRQTYSAIETGRRKMSWATYLSLVLLFVCDKATSTLFQNSEAFPVRIIEQINSDFSNNGFSFFSRIGNAKDIQLHRALEKNTAEPIVVVVQRTLNGGEDGLGEVGGVVLGAEVAHVEPQGFFYEFIAAAAVVCFQPTVHAVDYVGREPKCRFLFHFFFHWCSPFLAVGQKGRECRKQRAFLKTRLRFF